MGTLLIPADVWVSADWQNHKNRTPPSAEPGTDYATVYGTAIAVAESGVVSVVDTNPGGGEGRRVSFDLDNGQRVSYIHLSAITCAVGQRYARGAIGWGLSGASGYGSDYYYGPHVHVSLWERPGMAYSQTIDFQKYTGNPPSPKPPEKDDESEEDEMMKGAYYTRASDKVTVYLLFNEASGWYAEHTDVPGSYNNAIAKNWQTGSWSSITEGHAKVIKNGLAEVRQGK